MDIVPVRRQYQISQKSLLYRFYGTSCVVALVCMVIMATRAHAAESATGEVSPKSSTSQPQTPPAKKQSPDNSKSNSSSATIDAAKVREAIDAVRTDNSLAEELRARCQEVLTTTLKDLESRVDDQLEIEQLVKAAKSSEQRKKTVESTGDAPVNISLGGVTRDSNAAKIEDLLRTLNKDLLATTVEANRIQKELNARRTETKALPVQIAETEEELNSLVTPEENTDANPVLTTALKQATIAKRAKLVTALELSRQKILTYDAEASVLPLEKAALDKRAAALSKAITNVNAWVTRRHTDDI
ncbi:MAG TPA: hypothetical protein DEB70_05375, partial [Planctomycetaceae bacterium]|nr:hypothetical protein [Planctomycetaceae bacterium]